MSLMSNLNLVLLFALLSLSSATRHKCKHDELDIKLDFVDDAQPDDSSNNRLLLTYSNIRIYVDFTYLTDGNSIIREYIQNELMSSAVAYYQNTLSVVPFPTNLKFTSSCGGLTPPTYLQTTGVAADLVIMVTAESSTEGYLAYAIPCALATSNKRPIFGMINFNLRTIYSATDVDLQENYITTLHEMVHVFGFSSTLYQYYVNPTTNTPISATGNTTNNGVGVNYLKVEPLLTKLRTYFNCSTLEGAYLENQGESGSAGSHWERKTFLNEFMTASSIADSVISPFTLALLEGSGWYQVNYNNSEPFSWGKNKGCSFVRGSCMSNAVPTTTPEFCSSLQKDGCTFTSRAVGVCGTTNSKTTDTTLISQFNYWGNYTTVLDTFADNCPYYVGYPELDCENPNSKASAVLSYENFGSNSRCFTGTLTTRSTSRASTGYCFAVKCVNTGGVYSLDITVGTSTVTCTQAGTLTISGLNGQLDCPDPASFCAKANPVYCERGCSGRGTCTNGVCVCPLGWTGPDCGFRTYVDACSRCASSNTSSSCFGEGCSCNPATKNCTGATLIGSGDGGTARPNDGSSSTTNANILNARSLWSLVAGIVMMLLMI